VPYETFKGFLAENPHIRFFESRERGYVLSMFRQTPGGPTLRVVDTITQPQASALTLGSYVVDRVRVAWPDGSREEYRK
jgi:alkaline phosphatase D